MLKKILLALVVLLIVAIAVAAGGLAWAHVAIRRERAPLPSPETIASAAQDDELPVRLSVINTASQPMPRSAVLDPHRDPNPHAPYVMSHPSFVLEWADGRILLV